MSEAACCSSPGPARFDIPKLCDQPLLQSAFAETLRLRIDTGVVRVSEHEPFELGGYRIEKNHRMMAFARTLSLNTEAWVQSGRPPTWPLEEFQAERFLVPKKKDTTDGGDAGSTYPSAFGDEDLEFSVEGLAGCWLPFGGGQRLCPGRHFAKQLITLAFALLFNDFDIELSPSVDANKVVANANLLAVGGLPPVGRVSFRIRRKEQKIFGSTEEE